MWKYETRQTRICLCVNDFGIKYYSKDDITYFFNDLKPTYEYTVDWEGRNYTGIHLDWYYDKGYIDVYIPGYIPKIIKRLNHPTLEMPQLSPHEYFQSNLVK